MTNAATARRGHYDAANGGSKAAGNVVTDAIERDCRGQHLCWHLFAEQTPYQAGPNKAIPLPMMKQETSRRVGVMTPSHARTESEIEPANAMDQSDESDDSPIKHISRWRRLASTPARPEASMLPTSATIPDDDEIFVIVRPRPKPRTRSPRLDNRLAVQMRRNTA